MRILFLTVLCCCVSWVAQSQTRFGVSAGLNLSSLHSENNVTDYWDSKLGPALSIFVEHSFNKRIGLQLDLGYSAAGANFEYWGDKEPLHVHYLSVPVVFFYKPIDQLKFFVGPELNYLLQVQFDLNLSTGNDEKFKTIDYGLKAGIEYLPFPQWSISVKNYFGLHYNGTYPTNIHNDPDFETFKINRNNIFQVSIQYYFNE